MGVLLESRRRYKKQPRCRNNLKASWKSLGGVLEASGTRLVRVLRRHGGILEACGGAQGEFFYLLETFLFTIDGARIASPLGSHFFMISEATTRTYQTRIRIQKEAKVCIAASPGIL